MRTIFQEIIRYRGLIQTLVVRDLKARYRGSTLGLLWTLLNPLFHMAIYALVFSVYIRNDMPRFPAFLLCGILPWTVTVTQHIQKFEERDNMMYAVVWTAHEWIALLCNNNDLTIGGWVMQPYIPSYLFLHGYVWR